jgi:DNA primase
MTIQEIKQRLTIHQVLSHYGLKPDRNKRLHCPFHDDHTPSMQVYPATNTVFCFSANCKLNGKAIDVIDFIMYQEDITKRAAIEKAKQMIDPGYQPERSTPHPIQPIPMTTTTNLGRIAVLTKVFLQGKEMLPRSAKAQEYCQQRGLDPTRLDIGFLADRFYQSWNTALKQSAIEAGLLRENANSSLSPVFKNCIIFPMKNKEGQVVNMYGRNIFTPSTGVEGQGDAPRHFYLKGKPQGLYPGYPAPGTRTLLLTESIIDAASLQQVSPFGGGPEGASILALYGTNGFTDDHKQAIAEWAAFPHLEEQEGGKEIIFMLDADAAGEKAVIKHSETLTQLLPGTRLSHVTLPCKDINETYLAHTPEIFTDLINNRKPLHPIENKSEAVQTRQALSPSPQPSPDERQAPPQPEPPAPHLDTTNPDRILHETPLLKIEIWGGIEYHNMHRLRLSLHLENKLTGQGFRDDVNLYSHRSSKTFIQEASEEIGIASSDLKDHLHPFTRAVETYRLQQKANQKTNHQPPPVTLTPQEQKSAMKVLTSPHLVDHLKATMQKTGLVGETDNGLLLFLIFLTRYFDSPLHALVHGSSGSGKTNLLKSILKLVPEESKYETTALTENVLFRPPYKDFWKNKILLIEDLDGSYKALLPLREFMSNQYISKFASEPNPKTGKYEQTLLEAYGPIVIAGATTKDRLYEDNSNRSFLLHVNESKAHEEKVLAYQNQAAAGLIDTEGTGAAIQVIKNLQRMLNPAIKVINPFQPKLQLPEHIFTRKRTNTHYITLIKAITFLYQHQREKKTDENGHTYIETTLEDIALANALSKESMLRKSDELSGAVRDFFEQLKIAVRQRDKAIFLAKDIRSHLRMHPMKFSRYINELRLRGYVKKIGGKENGSYEYQIVTWDDYQVLQKGLEKMDTILESLRRQYPAGIYQEEEITVISQEITSKE